MEEKRCSMCKNWVHGVCKATGNRRNDGICNCSRFIQQDENK